jgi:hypothetical protein
LRRFAFGKVLSVEGWQICPSFYPLASQIGDYLLKIKQFPVQRRSFCCDSLLRGAASRDLTDFPAILTLRKSNWRLFTKD